MNLLQDPSPYFKMIENYEQIPRKREIELSKIIIGCSHPDDVIKARNELIEANLKLVPFMAGKFKTKYGNSNGLWDFDSLLEKGNEGLITAASHYDWRRGKFSTWACQEIHWAMIELEVENRLIRIPENRFDIQRAIQKLERKFGLKMTEEFILNKLEITEKVYKTAKEQLSFFTVADDCLYTIPDECNVREEVDISTLKEFFLKQFQKFGLRNFDILMRRFYFDQTFDQIAEIHGLTRQRIDQIIKKSLRILRNRFIHQIEKFV